MQFNLSQELHICANIPLIADMLHEEQRAGRSRDFGTNRQEIGDHVSSQLDDFVASIELEKLISIPPNLSSLPCSPCATRLPSDHLRGDYQPNNVFDRPTFTAIENCEMNIEKDVDCETPALFQSPSSSAAKPLLPKSLFPAQRADDRLLMQGGTESTTKKTNHQFPAYSHCTSLLLENIRKRANQIEKDVGTHVYNTSCIQYFCTFPMCLLLLDSSTSQTVQRARSDVITNHSEIDCSLLTRILRSYSYFPDPTISSLHCIASLNICVVLFLHIACFPRVVFLLSFAVLCLSFPFALLLLPLSISFLLNLFHPHFFLSSFPPNFSSLSYLSHHYLSCHLFTPIFVSSFYCLSSFLFITSLLEFSFSSIFVRQKSFSALLSSNYPYCEFP